MALGDRIEMRRLSDGAVYVFLRQAVDAGAPRYRRADKEIWIERDADFGWIVRDATDDSLMARPWTVALRDQGAMPPECDWVSRKGANAFVYRMVFAD
jgi:hypothetical protein